MGLRDRHKERRDGDVTTYRMRQRLASIGDDYWIEDEHGQRSFKVDGKALRFRKTLVFEDATGNELLKIQERKLRVRDTMEIEDASGTSVATVRKALISPLRERFDVEVAAGPDLEVKGNIVDHEYRITQDGADVAEVSKKWLRVADSYGVQVAANQDQVLILAVTAVIDSLTHEER